MPYFAFAPRWDYLPTFSEQISARQDFNLGLTRGSFQPVPIASDTAVFVIPSVSYVISKDWNASLGVELLGRWYDPNSVGFSGRDWEVLPVATVEYVIPASLFGFWAAGTGFSGFLPQSLVEFVGRASFGQFAASATIKAGWRF